MNHQEDLNGSPDESPPRRFEPGHHDEFQKDLNLGHHEPPRGFEPRSPDESPKKISPDESPRSPDESPKVLNKKFH